MSRRPAALVAPPVARLIGYALLAGLGALQWIRYVDGAPPGRALAWVAAGLVTALLVVLAARRDSVPLMIGAPLVGLFAAACASGIDLTLLEPNHWDELGDGVARGAEALNSVKLPYEGEDPWVLATVSLSGAGLCWAAALLVAGPAAGIAMRLAALVLLLVMAIAPVVSLGSDGGVALGLALTVIVCVFLWLERLPRRPGAGLVAVAAGVLLVAVPIGQAADREDPWFDYKAFSEKLGGGPPVEFDWDHEYGPIDWPREGAEMFRVTTDREHYWKVQTLDSFDGVRWNDTIRSTSGSDPEDDLPFGGERHADWDFEFRVTIRRLETQEAVGAGTVLDITDSSEDLEPSVVPGQWTARPGDSLSRGDAYRVKARIPQPEADELAEVQTVGQDPRRQSSLELLVPLQRPYVVDDDTFGTQVADGDARLRFPAFEEGGDPEAEVGRFSTEVSGGEALAQSLYDRTWELSQRLRRDADTPYDYVLAVNEFLAGPRFVYTERPETEEGEAPLETFLFDTKAGYCQQYSGAMVMLLRMGGIPARVATGFSPGGNRRGTDEWIVRDTDAHSWVEAWFDGIGWVTFDPTPGGDDGTPARSLIASLQPTSDTLPTGGGDASASGGGDFFRNPLRGPGGEVAATEDPAAGGATADGGTPTWVWILLAVAVVALTATGAAVARGLRVDTADSALAELERALRRTGRDLPAAVTLTQLEHRLGVSGEGYLRDLRRARYAAGGGVPDRAARAAFRRELAGGLGLTGRLRALWALPPAPRTLRR